MYDYLDVERGDREDVIIGTYEEVIKEGAADIVVISTDSFVKDSFDKIKYCLERKINVISTAEEMAYPQAQEPELAKEMDRIAKENGVSVLGTGINPGLMMDLLVLVLTGACTDVKSIKVERVNSLSPFGPAVLNGQGVGLEVEEFNRRVEEGTLAGHVGFPESITMIADALGWELDDIELVREPIVTNVYRKTPYIEVEPGKVAGCNMKGYGYVEGELKIEMLHPQQIEPQLEGVDTGDYITIEGTPNINMSIKPEVPGGGIGTIAMCVNMIPHVINASPGLKTMIDLPAPRAIKGDVRELID